MTYIFTLLLFLWLAAPVGAETTRLILSEPVREGDSFTYTCEVNGKKTRCEPIPNPCLARLEAAMRAMEPFSIAGRSPQLDKMAFPKDSGMRIEFMGEDQAQGVEALNQWDAAKRDCWRTP